MQRTVIFQSNQDLFVIFENETKWMKHTWNIPHPHRNYLRSPHNNKNVVQNFCNRKTLKSLSSSTMLRSLCIVLFVFAHVSLIVARLPSSIRENNDLESVEDNINQRVLPGGGWWGSGNGGGGYNGGG